MIPDDQGGGWPSIKASMRDAGKDSKRGRRQLQAPRTSGSSASRADAVTLALNSGDGDNAGNTGGTTADPTVGDSTVRRSDTVQETSINSARFVPTLGDRLRLIEELSLHNTPTKMYHWLKTTIISCRYIVHNRPLRKIRNDTIFLIKEMIDPMAVYDTCPSSTTALRKRALEISKQFDNTASAIMTNWDIRVREWEEYTPSVVPDAPNVAHDPFPARATPCSLVELEHLGLDKDPSGHILCPEHEVLVPSEQCSVCEARKLSIINATSSSVAECPEGAEMVYLHVSDPKSPPTEMVASPGYSGKAYACYRQVGFEGIRLTMSEPRGILAKWRVNLREALSYTILVANPSLMGHDV
ncbi:MAG: hypothetical protein GY906_08255, partial [bacterium]|nr:hypothetical protein [bacterium]